MIQIHFAWLIFIAVALCASAVLAIKSRRQALKAVSVAEEATKLCEAYKQQTSRYIEALAQFAEPARRAIVEVYDDAVTVSRAGIPIRTFAYDIAADADDVAYKIRCAEELADAINAEP